MPLTHADRLDGLAAQYANDRDREDFLALEAGAAAIRERDQLRAELAAAKERERVMCKPPSHCPVTGRPFFMILEGEDGEEFATYGGPFDSYTIPEWNTADAEFRSERYDHDAGYWVDGGEPYPFILVDESEQNGFIADLAAATARAEAAEAHAARWRGALEQLVSQIQKVEESPYYQNVWFVSHLHTGEYIGPQYGKEFEAAKAALAETPDQSIKRLQAEATRRCAAVLRDDLIAAAGDVQGKEFISAMYAASGWLEQMADGIEAEADRLDKEAANEHDNK